MLASWGHSETKSSAVIPDIATTGKSGTRSRILVPGAKNGRQLVDQALRQRPSLKILFTSGYTENAIVHHGRLDTGVLLLVKPYRKSELARMIRMALGG